MALNCTESITAGVVKDCNNLIAPIGLDKDLILVNYDEVDVVGTKDAANRELDNTNGNEEGLTAIKLKAGAVQHIFEGTDYSVVPTVTPEIREDGDVWYLHSVNFIVYDKSAKTRKILETLGRGRVLAIAVDRSTALYEVFGLDQGLKMTALERAYVGSQNSNFYSTTIATPDIAVMRESSVGELAIAIDVAI